MSDDYDERRPRRDNLMQQRLRRARGEAYEDDLDDVGLYDDDDDDRPRGFAPAGGGYAPRPAGGSGCALGVLYLLLGALLTLLIGGFFFNRALNRLGEALPAIPEIQQIIATPTPQIITGAAVVQRVQQLSRLETAAYTIERVIDIRQGSNIPVVGDFLAGDALLLIAHGNVTAGVDLSRLGPEAVTVSPDGTQVTLQLPPAEIFQATLDNSKTRVYSRDRGIFAPDNPNLETQARQEAEQQILQAACEDGIMLKATQNAEQAVTQLLGLFEFAQITVVPSSPAACGVEAAP
jgi:hypothetical protein